MTGPLTFEQQRRSNQQDWRIDRFCRRRGIHRRDLEQHPCWQDLVLLIHIRDEFQPELQKDRSLRATYNAYWGVVYAERHALRPRAFVRLELMVERCIEIRQQQQALITQIQSMRAPRQAQNTGHDMTAKGPNLPEKVSIREQQGGREDLIDTPPWV